MQKMRSSALTVIPSNIQQLISEGWEMEDDKGLLSLTLIITTGEHEGVSFVAYLDDWHAKEAEIYLTEFNKDNLRDKTEDATLILHDAFKRPIDDFAAMIEPYKARAYDWQGELEHLTTHIHNAQIAEAATELLAA